jgi:hypothetical protein
MRKFFDETIAEHLAKARILYWTELSFALARNTAAISDTGSMRREEGSLINSLPPHVVSK